LLPSQAALKLRATDLENIVDDLSDGEGDEEEGDRQRLLEEARQDRLKTKKILEALANGQKGAGRQSNTELRNRGLYGLDELVGGDIADLAKAQKEDAEDGNEEELDFDDDEELQAKYLNQMRTRIRGQRDDTAMDELSDEDEIEETNDEEGLAALTPEERAQRAKIAAIERENYRRYFEQALRNRALRMSNKHQEEPAIALQPPRPQLNLLGTANASQLLRSASVSEEHGTSSSYPPPPLIRPASSTLSCPPPSLTPRDGSELKRRVSMPPRKVDSHDGKLRRARPSSGATGAPPPQARKASAAKSDFTGVLNKDELEAGHGLFMGVSLSKRRRVSSDLLASAHRPLSVALSPGGRRVVLQPGLRGGEQEDSERGSQRRWSEEIFLERLVEAPVPHIGWWKRRHGVLVTVRLSGR
jgi:hypothetical protein